MPAPARVYHYDHESCQFVEVAPDRRAVWLRAGAVAALALVLAAVGVGVLSQVAVAPLDTDQQAEIAALRSQLAQANGRLTAYAAELDELAEADREIYRTVLNADPVDAPSAPTVHTVSDDGYGRYATPTATLLRRTSATMQRLERQMATQTRSYRELRRLAGRRESVLRQQPAILPVRDAPLTSGFGMRYHPVLHVHRMHAGVDFPTPVGTPVYATGDGVVSFVGTRSGYGTVLEIDHPLAGKMTRYAHLSRADVHVGQRVTRGQPVAFSGNTGLSTGPHLHYEVRVLDEARTPTNPVATFVPGITPSQYRELVAAARAQTVSFD